jgi:hypothetical protein
MEMVCNDILGAKDNRRKDERQYSSTVNGDNT